MTLSKHELFAFLAERPRIGRLATVTAAGEPRVVPVWFRVRDDRILVHTNPRMGKARNVTATGRFALAVDDDSWPYRGVSLWGSAHTVDPAGVVGDLRAFTHDLAASYLGAQLGGPMGESLSDPSWPHTILVLEPDGWLDFDYSR
ncbi:MAG: pyridoxamine 5'-phosphate oxidase family protein [Actinomycetota bacterium]